MQNLNDWQIVTLKQKEGQLVELEINILKSDALTAIDSRQEMDIEEGRFGAIKGPQGANAKPFHLVQWTSGPLELEERGKLSGSSVVHEPGTVYATCKIWRPIQRGDCWHEPPSSEASEQRIWIRHVYRGDLEVVEAEDADELPAHSLLHRGNKPEDCVCLPRSMETLVQMEREQRDRFHFVPLPEQQELEQKRKELSKKKEKKKELSKAKKKEAKLAALLNKNYNPRKDLKELQR